MVGWHHRLNRHEFEQTPGDSEGQGSLVCCSPWSLEESDMATEQQQQYHRKKRTLWLLFGEWTGGHDLEEVGHQTEVVMVRLGGSQGGGEMRSDWGCVWR